MRARLGGFTAIKLPQRGELRLNPEQAVTVESVRNRAIDDSPPAIGPTKRKADPNMVDDLPLSRRPYVAAGIEPFRLAEFTMTFSYGGWHNFNMIEYAATHGFQAIDPYVMGDRAHFPPGTQWLRWGTFVDWGQFLKAHDIPPGRYDQLVELDVTTALLNSGKVWSPAPDWIAMIDLEHGQALSPEQLRKQDWYPSQADASAREAFERKYYQGYLLTYTGPIQALRQRGWSNVGIYPQPYGSGWYDLLSRAKGGGTGLPDPETHWTWQRYGREMVEAQDVLYPDVYLYYWSPRNVAYTLARLDFDRHLVNSLADRKPIRPYFWPLLHGGSTTPHWWTNQPISSEDMRAIAVLSFFAGIDGWTLWNWSDVGNHHVPELASLKPDAKFPIFCMAGRDFNALPAVGGGSSVRLRRYDVLRINSVDPTTQEVRFQRIDSRKAGPAGSDKLIEPTVLSMHRTELVSHLRARSEPVSAAIEGLALVKALEDVLRHGNCEVDVPSIQQFNQMLPIVRRVSLGRLHLVATYDPMCIYDGPGRSITLNDFAGKAGRTIVLPADSQVRIFVLQEEGTNSADQP